MRNSVYIFYGSHLPISLSVDPLTEQTMTPYQYTYQNPIKFIDPTGMAAEEVDDWIKNKKTGEYIWRNEVTKPSETPEGYRYIGKENEDILTDLGWNVKYSKLSSKKIGYLAVNARNGKYALSHPATVEVTNRLIIKANVSLEKKNGQLLPVFNGVDISLHSSNWSISPNEIITSGEASFKFRGKNYDFSILPTSGEQIKSEFSNNSVGKITIPASQLTKPQRFPTITVKGNWWGKMDGGQMTPLIYHGVFPHPHSYKHTFKGFIPKNYTPVNLKF